MKIISRLPIILIIYPALTATSIFSNNLGQLKFFQLIPTLIIIYLITFLILGIAYFRFKNWKKASVGTTLIVVILFSSGHIFNIFPFFTSQPWIINFISYCIITTCVAFLFIVHYKLPDNVILIMNLMVFIMWFIPLQNFITYTLVKNNNAIKTENFEFSGYSSINLETSPDIYYIILDAYPRLDSALEYYDYDNSSFINELTNRGFFIADCSVTNYPRTYFSLSSTLNMNYLDFSIINSPSEAWWEEYIPYFEDSFTKNSVMSQLKSLGYKIVSFQSTFPFIEFEASDVVLSGNMRSNQSYEILYLSTTLLGYYVNELIDFSPYYYAENVNFIFSKIPEVPSLTSPKFVFIHIPVPHPPNIFLPNGSLTTDTSVFPPNSDIYVNGMQNQLEFINPRVIDLVDIILKKSIIDPIIVIQSDHGPFYLESTYLTPDDLIMPILNAYYLPGLDQEEILYETISPVNTFRVIFDNYFGTHMGLIEDRHYYMRSNLVLDEIKELPSNYLSCSAQNP